MAENYILLETIELSQVAASVTFDNLPSTGYTDLKLVASLRGTISTNWGDITVNGGATATTQNHYLNLSTTTIYSQQYSPLRFQVSGSTFVAGGFSSGECYFFNYANTSYQKTMSMEGTQCGSAGGYSQHFASGIWPSTAAITSITVTPDGGGNFAVGSTLGLYGLAATGTTPVTAPFATGGNIVANDGTYWYHAFLSSGTFTPFKALSCDVLVVAGGGGGGADAGGGGGAGGLLPFTSQSLTAQNYSAVIGAGGAGGPLNTSGTVGVDSQFGALTLVKGGGAGTRSGIGGAGGSGGGGSGRGRTTGVDDAGGTPTSGQGNAGGAGHGDSAPTTSQSGGGGGGSGAVGSAGTAATGGNGGIGTNTYSNWHTATNTGVSGYIAAGGGGAPYTAGTFGTGGSGGGGNSASNGASAIANTGSGGGASPNAGVGGNGASGLVIIRYTMV